LFGGPPGCRVDAVRPGLLGGRAAGWPGCWAVAVIPPAVQWSGVRAARARAVVPGAGRSEDRGRWLPSGRMIVRRIRLQTGRMRLMIMNGRASECRVAVWWCVRPGVRRMVRRYRGPGDSCQDARLAGGLARYGGALVAWQSTHLGSSGPGCASGGLTPTRIDYATWSSGSGPDVRSSQVLVRGSKRGMTISRSGLGLSRAIRRESPVLRPDRSPICRLSRRPHQH
jgi:hypothetical protein